MFTIGLTGGIASGKSTVAGLLKELGAWLIDADQLARQVVAPGTAAWQEIGAWLGPDIFLAGGEINRKLLGEKVFSNSDARRRLESITHPLIKKAIIHALQEASDARVTIAVLDVPLLFETGWNKLVDETWVVFVQEDIQLVRLMVRDQFSSPEALARIGSQMSLAEKVRLASRIIDNSHEIANTKRQVELAWQQVLEIIGAASGSTPPAADIPFG